MSDAPVSATAAASAAPAGAAAGVLRLYRRQLDERRLASDPAQLAVVAKLDDLRRRLIADSCAPRARLPRWLSRIARGAARAPPTGLYLWGGVGRGKTWLMDLFFETLPFAQARRLHFHRFMHDVHAQLAHIRRERSPLEHIARAVARDTRVLCLDELQVSDIADAMILGGLFEGLLRRGVTLVATSNVPPAELYRNGLQRPRFQPTIRLLERHLEVIRLGGVTDYRLRHLTQAGIYLAAGAPDTGARLAALFAALADHHAQAGGVIEIESRPIAVVRAGAGAVWFDFEALCSGPRSQND
ncbi:MAG: cell division protein ZapE, partial [Gammaproteobacteria bacterium]